MSERTNVIELLKKKNLQTIEFEIWNSSKKFQVEYNDLAFEILGLIMEGKSDINVIIKDLKEGNFMWKQHFFQSIPTINEVDEPAKVAEGTFRCKNPECKSYECYINQVQTRSLDEGATTFIVCNKCKHQYKL